MSSTINSRKSIKTKEPIEKRRENGEISCAECRRQKLRCDKAVPCGTCRRKGCESICPNGTLAPVHVPRLASGDTDLRMHKLLQMSKRVRQLEDALQIAHCSVPGATTHPLLSEELLKVKNITNAPPPVKSESDASDEETIDMVGTLVNMGRGVESYLGDEFVIEHIGSAEAMHVRVNLPQASLVCPPPAIFPFKPLFLPAEEIQAQIEDKLPSYERGSALIEAYLENISWLVRMVDREQLMEELMPQIYRRKRPGLGSASHETRRTHPHVLALLLAVFATGAVADLTLPPWNEEADLYYHLSWTAMGLESLFNGTNLYTIQALAVLGGYDIFSCRRTSLENSWKIVSFCLSLATSIGLRTAQKEAAMGASFYGRMESRPMALYPSVVDCELPEDTEATITKDGAKLPSFWRIRYTYSKEIMAGIVDKFTSVRPLKYSEVLKVDQKIRGFDLNMFLPANGPGHLRHLLMVLIKDASLLLLHRNFFVRALIENPSDPTRSRFAPSFLSTYRTASTILRAVRALVNDQPHIIARVWPFWAHALSASVMLGSVAACDASSLAPQAFVEFNNSIEMLGKMQIHPLIRDLMPTVLQLRDRAYGVLVRHNINVPYPQPPGPDVPTTGSAIEHSMVIDAGGLPQNNDDSLFRDSQGMTSAFLDGKISQMMTPSSSTTPSSGLQPGATSSHQCSETSRSSSSSSLLNLNQEDPVGSDLLHQSAFVPSPCDVAPSYQELLHTSGSLQGTSGDVGADSIHQSALHTPPMMQANAGRSEVPQSLTHLANHHAGGQNSGVPQHSGPSSHSSSENGESNNFHAPSNAGLEAFMSGQGSSEQTQMQLDPSLSFDSLSNLPLESFFNTDFDVSYDMRAAAGLGDESVLSHISEDLAACRTILTDSRFFGYGSGMVGTPTQL
ncbi:hypothetical protein A7U60_g3236 [Sanghuangporus baumii]|uniref:Zn(2)-C6 fungal-type domain-containing protein n=1 Tax=Sanghuangporus baumii TaxID=108892 RepID=A0A9Q5I0T5_SANBA|nr:hypothetical protein A7U60_g3236 [Sanghuangporus baumii]